MFPDLAAKLRVFFAPSKKNAAFFFSLKNYYYFCMTKQYSIVINPNNNKQS